MGFFDKLKKLKGSMDEQVGNAEQKSVDMTAKLLPDAGVSPELARSRAVESNRFSTLREALSKRRR